MSNSTEVIANNQPVFNFGDNQVRVVVLESSPWFVAADVWAALKLTNPSKAMKVLEPHERSNFKLGRQGDVNIVSESGLYTLILRCRDAIKPGTVAHKFKTWVTSEVLPSIRKNGAYEQTATAPRNPAIDYDRISPAQAQDLKEIVEAIVKAGVQGFGETWARLQRKFKVNSYLELPATRHLEVREYLIAKLPKAEDATVVDETSAKPSAIDDAVRLQHAFTLASQTAAKVQQAVFNGVMSGNADWQRSRYLLNLDVDGRDQEVVARARQVEYNACVTPINGFHTVIEESITVDAQTLSQLASTCMTRLSRMAQRAVPAATQAIGVAA